MFRNRLEAGLLLASRLRKYKNEPGIVLAVPRGGVPVAYAIARQLNLDVEVILTKKIGNNWWDKARNSELEKKIERKKRQGSKK